MSNYTRMLTDLQQERTRMQQEIRSLDQAIGALKRVWGRSQVSATAAPKRRLSLAGRRRIAAAQRARWAKFRQQKLAA